MSSDSDTEDDIQIKRFLEAADTTLLNDTLFERKEEKIAEGEGLQVAEQESSKKDKPKSQRYTFDDNVNSGTDFNLPESMQKHLAKKLNDILKNHYELYDFDKGNSPKGKTKHKSRVKLLKGADCFVNAYEDFQYDIKAPKTKPILKRRIVDDQTNHNISKDALNVVAVDGNYIMSGQEVKTWAKKRERKDKVFYYKMDRNGILHAKEETNEFTKIRRKNKWNESKIHK